MQVAEVVVVIQVMVLAVLEAVATLSRPYSKAADTRATANE